MVRLYWRNLTIPPGVGDPVHVRKFIARNLGDPERFPIVSSWDDKV